MTEKTELHFEVPGRDAPGFLRRSRKALEFSQSLSENPAPEDLDKMVEFLVQYVTKPEKHEDKLDALWDASQEDFEMLLSAITGDVETENPTD
jgi:hypothetical protein